MLGLRKVHLVASLSVDLAKALTDIKTKAAFGQTIFSHDVPKTTMIISSHISIISSHISINCTLESLPVLSPDCVDPLIQALTCASLKIQKRYTYKDQ